MITKINIRPYLAEYIYGKYGTCDEQSVQFPDSLDIYHIIYDLLEKRPEGVSPADDGNLAIHLPQRRLGKNPETYNFLSIRAKNIIAEHIKRIFDNDLHACFEENLQNGRDYENIEVAFLFMKKYKINSISEDALLKNYYRWRDAVRKKSKRRKYKRVA